MADNKQISDLLSISSILIIGVFSAVGSFFSTLIQGKNVYLVSKNLSWKPCFENFEIPDLIASILFGMLARNVLSDFMDSHYNELWAENTRMICSVVILLRGGLELKFKGRGKIVFLMGIVPMAVEALIDSVASKFIMNGSWSINFSMGFLLCAVSPAAVVPIMIYFIEKKLGTRKGIPNGLIASSSIDVILSIICFGICSNIAVNEYSLTQKNPGNIVGKIIYSLLAGLGCGGFLGLISIVLKNQNSNAIKFVWLMITSMGMTVMFYYLDFKQANYLSVITLGYIVKRVWNEKKPDRELRNLWFVLKFFLFGTIGAAINLQKVKTDNIGFGLAIFFIGWIVRAIVSYFVPSSKDYTKTERLFFAASWLPKATVQAALGGSLKGSGISIQSNELIDYGDKLLTASVFSILVSASIGSVLSFYTGQKYLALDSEEEVPTDEMQKIKEEKDEVDGLMSGKTTEINPDSQPV